MQITGNLLNLPSTIRRSGSVKAAITYLADGTRTKTVDASGAGYVYRGSFVYDAGGGVLRDVAFGRAGRFLRSGAGTMGDVCYFVTDHLGSTRAVVKAGSVVERDDYYPFGARHDDSSLPKLAAIRHRFGGKEELDDAFGVAYSDFGARLYARSASWSAIDPMAEKYPSVSPYAYCNDDPNIITVSIR